MAVSATAAEDNVDSAQEQRLAAAQLLIQEGRPGEAIDSEIAPVIAFYEGRFINETRVVYCARTREEASAYMALAAAQKHAAMVIGPQWANAYFWRAYFSISPSAHFCRILKGL